MTTRELLEERIGGAAPEVRKAVLDVIEAAMGASCDSHSGLYCDDDSCANKVLPEPLDRLLKMLGREAWR
jgi:hypothetical protein